MPVASLRAMKIDQIPIGTRFQLKGRCYTKVGPMTAAADGGGTTFVPKHAVLQPAPGETPPAPSGGMPDHLDGARVQAAFDDYHRCALSLVGPEGQGMLEAARRHFFDRLG